MLQNSICTHLCMALSTITEKFFMIGSMEISREATCKSSNLYYAVRVLKLL